MSADKDYLSLPMREFLVDLGSKTPTPGGGSLAALVGAAAVAQARMVLVYSMPKGAPGLHEDRLAELLDEFQRAHDMFVRLMREDMAAYERFDASRKSDDVDEKQRAVATTAAVPLEIATLAGAVLARLDDMKAFTNPNLFCDLQVAAVLACAAAHAARINAQVNIDALADRDEAGRLASQLTMLVKEADRLRNAVVDYQTS